ncbi:hypothetical protein RN001_000746 [Aquatica leii]|uniref:Microsomal glutathione S-transferase 1 n=1 Tax=Aquatica leii TaxID=1421715 RepID=A0AAN7SSI1_9COLE|nr:hypothetical protein RN001_000746 [Aquatica leii]
MSYLSKLISFDNPAFCGYITYSSILVLKMMVMSILTGSQRKKHGVISSPEDAAMLKGKQIIESHPDVDRVRRAHLNDLENIPIFFLAGLGYVLTDPNPAIALNLFRMYTLARVAHTFVYAIYVVPQPARGISWGIGYAITGYMAVRTMLHFGRF